MTTAVKKMSAMLTALAVVFAICLTSCGDDNDEPEPAPGATHPAKIGVAYSLELGDAWWDFFDIEVSYTTPDGQLQTRTVHKGWVYAASTKYEIAAREFKFSAKATPKASQPQIDPNATYNLNHAYTFTAYGLKNNDEQESVLVHGSGSATLSMAGSKFAEYAAKPHETLGSGSWKIK